MLGTAREEIERSKQIWDSTAIRALREQQEDSLGLWSYHKFEMDKSEGSWNDVTTNSSKVLANKIIGLLASSWLQLFIDVDDETRKRRKKIAFTEQLANGILALADRALTSVPSGKSIQDTLSFFSTIKGGTVKLVYLLEDGDGQVVPDIRVPDPTFCQWIEGDKEIIWFCQRNYLSKQFIEKAYAKQLKDGFNIGTDDSVLAYTFWDAQSWKVAIREEYIDSDDHNLGYIPVNIRTCGSAPFVRSSEKIDAIKYSWMDVFANNRDIYDLESKLLSIESSKAIESGKIKLIGEKNSTMGEVEGIEKLGYASGGRNEIVMFDAAKGQKFGGMVQPPTNELVDRFLARVVGMNQLGSLDPIAQGVLNRSGSGALAAELRAAALEFINPFRLCVEQDFIWIAEESVRQFKNGDFGKMKVEGKDSRKVRFSADISPKDVEERRFDCELVAERLRDEIQELGAAIQKVQYGLSSRRTVMVEHNIVEDPDLEQDKMDEELAAQDPVFKFDKLAKYFKDQGTEEGDRMAQYYAALSAITIEKTVKDAIMRSLVPSGGEQPPGEPPVGVPLSPQAEVGRIASEPMR